MPKPWSTATVAPPLRSAAVALIAALLAGGAAQSQTPPLAPDIPSHWLAPDAQRDFSVREVMIPMRDGTKLFTLIVLPKGARDAPILLTRTPYNASARLTRSDTPHVAAVLPPSDAPFLADGYIRVFQDVRGKYRSEGDYVMTRPLRGPLNASEVDHATDAYDTIDWLVKNLPESNGRVGMIGSSYEGFTVVMALMAPHPALKAAVPENPMIDGWKGDDWFHNGAFRQVNLGFFSAHLSVKGDGSDLPRTGLDDYDNFRRAGSAGDMAKLGGIDQLPYWRKLTEHPAYDAYWQGQALDQLIATHPLVTPTLWVAALWDQEDMWGAVHAYAAVEPQDRNNDMNFLALGPWRHSGVNYDGSSLGPIRFEGDTARQFRDQVLKPFLDGRLKSGAIPARTPPVYVYETGTNQWRTLSAWPTACVAPCAAATRPLYLRAGGGLSLQPPTEPGRAFDTYQSDPAKPVPYVARPVRRDLPEQWRTWLVADQRFVDGRPDVLTYVSDVLTTPLKVSGTPHANLFASTSGSDADWVVKLIDVYPDEVPGQAELGGYQLMVSGEIFRGRYRQSTARPTAIRPDTVEPYGFDLPQVNHVFLPGHRVMVQIQSSWFPLYDRNPQTFVENIFFAKPASYRAATQRIERSAQAASFIALPTGEAQPFPATPKPQVTTQADWRSLP
jgi:putative CocE/NonD family hydrolase